MNNDKQGNGSAYLAFMRIDYEGIYESSMKLFKSKTEAEKYICELREKEGRGAVSYDIVNLYYHINGKRNSENKRDRT